MAAALKIEPGAHLDLAGTAQHGVADAAKGGGVECRRWESERGRIGQVGDVGADLQIVLFSDGQVLGEGGVERAGGVGDKTEET